MPDLLSTHLRGLIARFSMAVTEPPPRGEPGTEAAAYRAGWMSADRALEAKGDAK